MTNKNRILSFHVIDNVKNWLKYYVSDKKYNVGYLDLYLKHLYDPDMMDWIEHNIYAYILTNLDRWYKEVRE